MKYQNRVVLLIYLMPIRTWENNPYHLLLSNLILRHLIQEHCLLIIAELLWEAQLSSRAHRNNLWAIWAPAAAACSRESHRTAAHTSKVSQTRTSWHSRSIFLRVGKKLNQFIEFGTGDNRKQVPKSSTALGAGGWLAKTTTHMMLRITGQDCYR